LDARRAVTSLFTALNPILASLFASLNRRGVDVEVRSRYCAALEPG
jgi:hypothetical protein